MHNNDRALDGLRMGGGTLSDNDPRRKRLTTAFGSRVIDMTNGRRLAPSRAPFPMT
jgi:hypothetical protein